ncbi:DUF2269 family protein [Microbacterium sp. STN6]|uniref:DUF2269 family protein n=1 Tax=Microbacterium sp. STN6 TaxID=2995588 RepID=UPI002260C6AD|nr:DUF2269 family protein [Microbacterium sp. STN6]MCX7520948.1 DUF2269 family protein [Microbacterium sp. STN6]
MGTLLNVLHVVAAVFIIGPMAILPHLAPRLIRTGHGGQVVALAKSVTLFSWLSLIVVVFGFGVMGMYKIPFDRTWIWLSIVLYVIALLLSLFLVAPAMRRAGQALELSTADAAVTDTPASGTGVATEKPSVGAISGGAGIATLCLIAVVVFMVWHI